MSTLLRREFCVGAAFLWFVTACGGNDLVKPDASTHLPDASVGVITDAGPEASPIDASVGDAPNGPEASPRDGGRDTDFPPDAKTDRCCDDSRSTDTSIDASQDAREGSATAANGFNFDRDLQGWMVTYTSASSGVPIIAAGAITLSLNTTDGQPNPGSLEAAIPYSAAGQYVGLGVAPPMPINLSGKILRAQVKIVSGFEAAQDLMTSPAGAHLYVRSGSGYRYASGVFQNLTTIGNWVPITFDLASPGYIDMLTPDAGPFDPSDIREIGLQFDTSGTTTTAQPAVVLVDSVSY